MSYQKVTLDVQGLAEAVTDALAQDKITSAKLAAELTAAGAVVQLETGSRVWVSCVVHDRPDTPEIDLAVLSMEVDEAGAPRKKANGNYVSHAFWSNVWPARLAELGVDTVRKALMMVALGEPQPQVPIPNPDPEPAPQTQDAVPMATPEAHSIRSQITAADELAAPLADVL
ncbi:MAG TPA: hypothetical protein VFW82_06710 [Dyella sp.]|nr:hypothetical protein [Dyella sp.]